MEPTLEHSLSRIFGGRVAPTAATPAPAPAGRPGAPPTVDTADARAAWEAWTRSQEALRRGDWAAYGAEQKRLEETLRRLVK
jgi:uncharacterized membrane protein (UPF0182 family)